ncbi:MAG TPA: class I SAM-dependent methyltransferase [Candidatus Acidoferrum sp.]|nr:class I SAM-dependent methyltransferase [Candidatus Acidoferrum sp.]
MAPADHRNREHNRDMSEELEKATVKAAATYNAAADHFDDAPLAFWERYGRRTVERLALAEGARVLDVGCGTGASALPAAERVGAAGRVIGVDLAESLLRRGREKAQQRGLRNIEFRCADMTALPFADGDFDAVVCVFAIFFVPDMERQVAELWRMVRPGGRLAITTWGPRMFEPGSSAWWAAVKQARPDLVPAVSPWERITTPGGLRQLLAGGGIADAEVVPEEGRQTLRSPDDWWTVVLGSGYRWTVDRMDEATVARVRAATLDPLRQDRVSAIETNVIYALATKP